MIDLYVSVNGNITVKFTLGTDTIKPTDSLVLTFPPEYGNLRVYDLKCTLTPIVLIGEPNPANIQYPLCTSTSRSVLIPLALELE